MDYIFRLKLYIILKRTQYIRTALPKQESENVYV